MGSYLYRRGVKLRCYKLSRDLHPGRPGLAGCLRACFTSLHYRKVPCVALSLLFDLAPDGGSVPSGCVLPLPIYHVRRVHVCVRAIVSAYSDLGVIFIWRDGFFVQYSIIMIVTSY